MLGRIIKDDPDNVFSGSGQRADEEPLLSEWGLLRLTITISAASHLDNACGNVPCR